MVLAVFGGLLLFVALHCNVFLLSIFSPIKVMEVVSVPALLVISTDSRYQVIVGAGAALLLTSHWTTS